LSLFKHDEHSIPEPKRELIGNLVEKLELRMSHMRRPSTCAVENEALPLVQ
jgi:hypothetical protein